MAGVSSEFALGYIDSLQHEERLAVWLLSSCYLILLFSLMLCWMTHGIRLPNFAFNSCSFCLRWTFAELSAIGAQQCLSLHVYICETVML